MTTFVMHRLTLVLLFAVVFCNAAEDDDSFSIGLGVLSPSYKQTIGKEKVKVSFDQKEDGQFSYSIGDPKSGNSQFLSFGPSAGQQQQPNAAAYAEPAPSGYAAPAHSGYAAPAHSGYAAPAPSGYAAPAQSPTFTAREPSGGYVGSPMAAGYRAPDYGSNNGYAYAQDDSPSGIYLGQAGSSFGLGQSYGSSAPRKPEGSMGGILPSGFSYHATEGQAFLRQGGELRQPPSSSNQIMPAGFSYHGTEGQSFLRQGDSPNFVIAEDKQGSSRGPAEDSFFRNYDPSRRHNSPRLVNGLVGYGPGGPTRGSLPIGGYAGAEHQGVFKENGGHSE